MYIHWHSDQYRASLEISFVPDQDFNIDDYTIMTADVIKTIPDQTQ